MPEVTPVCVDGSTSASISCAVAQPYIPNGFFTLELELSPGVWTAFTHLDSYTFGPFEVPEDSVSIAFRLTNTGDLPMEIDYTFGSTDLFAYDSPMEPETISLGLLTPYLGSFFIHKQEIDQEILNLSFISASGPKIVISLRSSTFTNDFFDNAMLLDLSDLATDGTALSNAIALGVYIYDGVATLRKIRTLPFVQFGQIIDLTASIINNWEPSSESIVVLIQYNELSVDLEEGSALSLSSSSGASTTFLTDIDGQYTDELSSAAIVVDNEITSSFVMEVEELPPAGGPGSIEFPFSTAGATIPVISAYSLNNFTFEFWVRVKSSPGNQAFGRVFDNDFSAGFDVNVRAGTPALWFECVEINSTLANPLDSATGITLDVFEHYAFVRDGTAGYVYRNASLVKTLTLNSTLFTPTAPTISVGSKGAELAAGFVADFRLWNVARTIGQIAANYQSRLTGFEAGLVAYYKFNQTDGVFTDSTGNNAAFTNNGCAYSATTPAAFP